MPELDEPISPELALVCPELRAKALLLLPPPPSWELQSREEIDRECQEVSAETETADRSGVLLGVLVYTAARVAAVALQGAAVAGVLVVLLVVAYIFG